ncbi:adhesin [Mesomycoplasma ovipneumoniae]|uniref:Adhesin n=1 Tax=Mesomycoplasma ovipneumoniae TaxID=29562 RepID=A0AAW6Q5A7_9BACT|nr:adhesin [Mesomycoplasma ovipneumoniae]MDF9627963.1 adhesin [Mesomycoplasma ovipneumoniae]MDO4158001.1 adhesin [Mesomycoplasma ovipneumoniae]MDO4158154.1 adhesin [Mesomycoplasma ovipneumoniae]MDO6821842.1 adhesin [Mesomycoplasma ovipneumoniae]MDO6855682.1 adhesin [Mesomycoplasma ovipneumoniae]
MPKNTNRLAIAITAVGGVAIFATTIGLVTRIRYTGENPRAELESLVSRVQNVAFKSDVFDDSTTYSQIKSQLFDQSGKLLAGTDLNKFISFYTQVNSKLRKFEPTFAPNKPFLEFIDLIPNDNDQSFELRFRAKHQVDNNHTAFSTIISKKVSYAQRSQFALAEFNSNLEKITKSFKENIQNLRRTDFSSSVINPSLTDQKIASLTRAEDFAADINRAGTQTEAIEKISQYFPDFQKLINELNFDKNNFFPFKQGTIYNFSLEKHPGTNNFISVGPNSVPSFLVKAELSDDAKFELKNFNIEDAQLLEKIDLVPQASSSSESSHDQETAEKQAKKPTYFADVDDILSKISLRKLQFTDFKVGSQPVQAQAQVQTQASSLSSGSPEIRQLVQVSADLTQGQTQPQAEGTGGTGQQGTSGESAGTGAAGAGAAAASGEAAGSNGTTSQQADGATTTEQTPAETPAQSEDKTKELVKYLEISTRTVNDFFASFNKKIYSSVREKSKELVDKINSELLIKPISLDFGEFNQYFDKKQPQGVDFYLDLSKAQEKDGVNPENSNLEIPVVINLYSSFFGDSENKLLGSKTSVFEIPNFKKVGAQTGSGTVTDISSNLDTERKTFYNLDGLPTTSASQPTSVSVSASTIGAQTTQNKQIRIGSTTAYISKTELENLIGQPGQTSEGTEQNSESKAPKFEEIKKIIGNPFQYAYDFDANESMLKAWVGQQKFPKPEDFANFTENNFIASDYKIKSLRSDKFFKNEYDVASFYAYLIQKEPAQVLNYLFEIAKANGLVDKNASINLTDIIDNNIFKIASDVKLKTTETNPVYSLDFNNQFLGFDSRGWISNLFLPKSVWDKTKTLINDSDIFNELNQYSAVKVEANSSSGSGDTSLGSTDGLYKTLQEAAKKIKEALKKQSSAILKAGDGSGSGNGGGSGSGENTQTSIETEIKKFFEEKTQPLSTLKDLLLAFYFKAKELSNFNAWSKLGSDLDYKIVFEKQASTSSGSGETVTTPAGLEDYKLTYYYKVFDKNTGVDKYQTPKIELNLWVNKQDTQKTEKDELNKAVLSIPPSFSLFFLKKDDFDKIKKDQLGNVDKPEESENSNQANHKSFEQTEVFKEIQAKIQENNKDLKISVVSIDEDKINPKKFKVVNLQIEKTTTPVGEEGSATSESVKSSLSFQVRIALDDLDKK